MNVDLQDDTRDQHQFNVGTGLSSLVDATGALLTTAAYAVTAPNGKITSLDEMVAIGSIKSDK